MATPERDSQGRFSRRRDDDLFGMVREIAVLATRPGADPRKVTQEAWYAARVKSKWPDAARPDEICRQLDRGWRELLSDLFSGKSLEHVERARLSVPDQAGIDDARIYHSLRRVLLFTGKETLSEADYLLGHQELTAQLGRRRRPEAAEPSQALLTLDQIKTACNEDWNVALSIAGLTQPERKSPAPEARAISLVEAIKLFLKETGEWPTLEEARQFADDKGRALTKPRSLKLSEAIAAVREELIAAGQSAPEWSPGRHRKRQLTWQRTAEAAEAEAVGLNVRITRALREFLELCDSKQPKEAPTLRYYKALCRLPEHADWPAGSAMQRRGSWPQLLKGARAADALQKAQALDAAAFAENQATKTLHPKTPEYRYDADDPRALEILNFLRELGAPAGNKAIRDKCGLKKQTTTRLLAALVRAGEVESRGGGQGRVYFIPAEAEREAA